MHHGIPEGLAKSLNAISTHENRADTVGGTLLEELPDDTGVLQGDILHPFLFIPFVY